jgi:hypothetical protein
MVFCDALSAAMNCAEADINVQAAQGIQVHRGQLTEEARVDANAQTAHR